MKREWLIFGISFVVAAVVIFAVVFLSITLNEQKEVMNQQDIIEIKQQELIDNQDALITAQEERSEAQQAIIDIQAEIIITHEGILCMIDKGDINNDGVIDIADYTLLRLKSVEVREHILGIKEIR